MASSRAKPCKTRVYLNDNFARFMPHPNGTIKEWGGYSIGIKTLRMKQKKFNIFGLRNLRLQSSKYEKQIQNYMPYFTINHIEAALTWAASTLAATKGS